ncbi:MAG: glycerophosphodiester phosphodiesterase family protein, partial [Anaerolineae bacterium]|nr:glycerophosphodiester phosphodiesterase family protein [Anaerolineae bacterium]
MASTPQLIAHRGGKTYQPENTLAAFKQAIADGVDQLEFDVQMTKDGVLVVIHDEEVDRTTNGSGLVADLTLAEIQALDAGGGERVPTFAE